MKQFAWRSSHAAPVLVAAIALVAGCSTGASPADQSESASGASSPPAPGNRIGPYKITYVYDGDTAVVESGAESGAERLTVRVVGINTPEVAGPHTQEQCFGPEASERAKQILLGQQVWLERDPNQGKKDKYDRDLAFIWIDNRADFGLQMVRGGYAREFTYAKPYPHQAEYKAAQTFAQTNKLGLWSHTACSGTR